MVNIQDILSEDFSKYPEEVQEFMKKYSDILREKIKEKLIEGYCDDMIHQMNNDIEAFRSSMFDKLSCGWKGYDNIPTKMLLNMYLEKGSGEDFSKLIESVNSEF